MNHPPFVRFIRPLVLILLVGIIMLLSLSNRAWATSAQTLNGPTIPTLTPGGKTPTPLATTTPVPTLAISQTPTPTQVPTVGADQTPTPTPVPTVGAGQTPTPTATPDNAGVAGQIEGERSRSSTEGSLLEYIRRRPSIWLLTALASWAVLVLRLKSIPLTRLRRLLRIL